MAGSSFSVSNRGCNRRRRRGVRNRIDLGGTASLWRVLEGLTLDFGGVDAPQPIACRRVGLSSFPTLSCLVCGLLLVYMERRIGRFFLANRNGEKERDPQAKSRMDKRLIRLRAERMTKETIHQPDHVQHIEEGEFNGNSKGSNTKKRVRGGLVGEPPSSSKMVN